MLPISVNVSIQKPTGILLPNGNFKFIEHDDLAKDDEGQRIRAPEVKPLYWVEYSPLTEAWQWYWFRVGLVHPYTGYEHFDETRLKPWELDVLKREWRSLTHGEKAFTNNHGTNSMKPDGSNGGRDYISNRNMDSDKLPAQGAITCAGNILRVMGDRAARGWPVLTLNGMKPPPDPEQVNRLTHPHLIFCATNVPGYKVNNKEFPFIVESGANAGRIQVDPFPNLVDVPTSKSIDTLVPLRSNGNKVIVTFAEDGVHYAINYFNVIDRRFKDFPGTIVPTAYIT